MSIEVKFRRGTSAEHTSFTGANGEITIDTTIKTLRVHDGVTAGGIRIAKYSDLGSAANLESISTNLIPNANVTYDIGTSELAWRDLYLSGNTIYLGGKRFRTTSNTVIIEGATGAPIRLVTDSIAIGDVDGGTATILKSVDGRLNTVSAADETQTLPTNFANVNITNLVLQNVLGTQYGGTGLTSFTQNGVMFASNSSVLGFVTGTAGKIMQIGSSGVPEFNDLDGGDFA
jgi:hypothetical protein